MDHPRHKEEEREEGSKQRALQDDGTSSSGRQQRGQRRRRQERQKVELRPATGREQNREHGGLGARETTARRVREQNEDGRCNGQGDRIVAEPPHKRPDTGEGHESHRGRKSGGSREQTPKE